MTFARLQISICSINCLSTQHSQNRSIAMSYVILCEIELWATLIWLGRTSASTSEKDLESTCNHESPHELQPPAIQIYLREFDLYTAFLICSNTQNRGSFSLTAWTEEWKRLADKASKPQGRKSSPNPFK